MAAVGWGLGPVGGEGRVAALIGWCTLELWCGWEVAGGPTNDAFT